MAFNLGSRIQRLKDTEDFHRQVTDTPMRVMVEGTRGKSTTVLLIEQYIHGTGIDTLAKVTGEVPILVRNGTVLPIDRKNKAVLLDYDNVPAILKYQADAIILENQAITPYTMQYMHRIFRPLHVVIPNIRIDHTEGLGDELGEMADNFTKNYLVTPDIKQVYYTEPIRRVHDLVYPVFRDFAAEHPDRVRLHDVKVPEGLNHLPGIENYVVAAYFMAKTYREIPNPVDYIGILKERLRIRYSSLGVEYFNAAKVNDPISFIHLISYLLKQTDSDIAFVAYMRRDRPGRVGIFRDFLPEIHERFGERTRKFWVAGYAREYFYDHMPPQMQAITENIRGEEAIDEIIRYCRESNLILIPIINRVNPFMEALVCRLEGRVPAPPDSPIIDPFWRDLIQAFKSEKESSP